MMNFSHERTIPESLREYGGGVGGGLIFAIPLLFTRELWNITLTTDPGKLGLYVVFTFGVRELTCPRISPHALSATWITGSSSG